MYESTAASAGAEAAGLLPSLHDLLLPGCTEDSALMVALAAGGEKAETVKVVREGAYAASASMTAAPMPGDSGHSAILESPRGPKRAFACAACSRAFSTHRSLSLHAWIAHSAPAPETSNESIPSDVAPAADAGTAAATRARLQAALERNEQWMAKFTKVNRAEHPGVTFHAVWGAC